MDYKIQTNQPEAYHRLEVCNSAATISLENKILKK